MRDPRSPEERARPRHRGRPPPRPCRACCRTFARLHNSACCRRRTGEVSKEMPAGAAEFRIRVTDGRKVGRPPRHGHRRAWEGSRDSSPTRNGSAAICTHSSPITPLHRFACKRLSSLLQRLRNIERKGMCLSRHHREAHVLQPLPKLFSVARRPQTRPTCLSILSPLWTANSDLSQRAPCPNPEPRQQ